jgi:hypothetical protein
MRILFWRPARFSCTVNPFPDQTADEPVDPALPDEAAPLEPPELPVPLPDPAPDDESEGPAGPASNDTPPPLDEVEPASATFAGRSWVPQPVIEQGSASASTPDAAIPGFKAAP